MLKEKEEIDKEKRKIPKRDSFRLKNKENSSRTSGKGEKEKEIREGNEGEKGVRVVRQRAS